MGDWKGWAWNKDHGFTFSQMWDLLDQANVVDTRVEFSNALLIGLFWEESVFQNWWQLDNSGTRSNSMPPGLARSSVTH
jgi:hypothetical protein